MRLFLYISYLGTNYHGWQKQKNSHTVQKEIENALSKILNSNTILFGSGRTDSGVHAIEQVAHFELNNLLISLDQLKYKLNSVLPYDISIKNIKKVSNLAHARFDAIKRTYVYKISTTKDPFLFKKVLYRNKELDVELLNQLSKITLNTKNFKSFTKNYKAQNHFNCKIFESEWYKNHELIEFKITANRFLHGMVRSLVGTMLKALNTQNPIMYFTNIIESQNRSSADCSIDPCGLYLKKIEYPDNIYLL